MALIVDNRATVPGAGIHALIAGVSQYDHLPGIGDPPDDATWGLTSLGSTAISAAQVAGWILDNTAQLALPLKSLRLLLSPTPIERPLLPAFAGTAAVPDLATFRTSVNEWRTDCRDNPGSVAFFYYAGHGFTRGRGDYNLLLTLADLFTANEPEQTRTALASNIFNGMAPQTLGDTIARPQIFFFDCCRTIPKQMASIDDRSVTPVLSVSAAEGVVDDRAVSRFHAVPDTASAFASAGKGTYFAASVLDALNRACRNVRGSGWQLDGEAIEQRLKARYKTASGRDLDGKTIGDGPVLMRLAAPRMVDVQVSLEPLQMANGRLIALERAGNAINGTPIAAGQHTVDVPPGEYELKVCPPAGSWTDMNDRQIVLPDFENPWISRGWP